MPIEKISHPAALVSAVVFFLWGWLWYSVFGNQWLELIQKTRADLNPQDPVPYLVSFAMALVVAYAMAITLSPDDNRTAAHGAQFGIFTGVAFVASMFLQSYLFEGRPVALWLINAGYPVTGMAIVGAIIGAWKKKAT